MKFIINFDPFRGDVIYGTTGARTTYLERFLESYQRRLLEWRHGTTFSLYRTKGFYINDYNEPITDADFTVPSELDIRANSSMQTHYLQALNGTRYSPSSVGTRGSMVAYAKGDSSIVADTRMTKEEWAKAAMVLAIRRACKFGIEYVSTYRNAHVHYILDEIDMDVVVQKGEVAMWTGKVGVPITTSELRYLFRTWHIHKNNTKLHFYLNQNEVKAPWMAEPGRWVAYAQHRVDKYRERLEGTERYPLQQFDRAILRADAASAIRWFHAMTAYEVAV
jgi:hypothetical protein